MSEEVESDSHRSTPAVRSTPVLRRFIIYAGVLLVVFLLGFVPMWLQARASATRLAEAERRLTLVGMQSDLASAAIRMSLGSLTTDPTDANGDVVGGISVPVGTGANYTLTVPALAPRNQGSVAFGPTALPPATLQLAVPRPMALTSLR